MNPPVDRLCRALEYRFQDDTLLLEALTHRSASSANNERLEFLGDSVLNFIIADTLFAGYPRASEGELSRLRACLVKRDTLAQLARSLALGDYLHLGRGELKSGGFRRDTILADALEAILGAVYLDGGFECCRTLVMCLFSDDLAQLPPVDELKDPKTRLQEYLQARQRPLPVYQIVEVSGEAHDQQFKIECALDNLCTTAVGTSRRKAEQEAARRALELIE